MAESEAMGEPHGTPFHTAQCPYCHCRVEMRWNSNFTQIRLRFMQAKTHHVNIAKPSDWKTQERKDWRDKLKEELGEDKIGGER